MRHNNTLCTTWGNNMHGDGWARDYCHIPQIREGQSVQIWVTLHRVGEHKLLLTTCSQEGQHLQFELERILHKYINRLNMQSWCFKIIRVATILCAVVGPTTVARPRIYLRTKSHWGKGAICRGGLVLWWWWWEGLRKRLVTKTHNGTRASLMCFPLKISFPPFNCIF